MNFVRKTSATRRLISFRVKINCLDEHSDNAHASGAWSPWHFKAAGAP